MAHNECPVFIYFFNLINISLRLALLYHVYIAFSVVNIHNVSNEQMCVFTDKIGSIIATPDKITYTSNTQIHWFKSFLWAIDQLNTGLLLLSKSYRSNWCGLLTFTTWKVRLPPVSPACLARLRKAAAKLDALVALSAAAWAAPPPAAAPALLLVVVPPVECCTLLLPPGDCAGCWLSGGTVAVVRGMEFTMVSGGGLLPCDRPVNSQNMSNVSNEWR